MSVVVGSTNGYQNIAELADLMVELDGEAEFGLDAAAMELRAALRLTRRMAEVEVDFANTLKHRLPAVGRAMWSGEIDVRRARVLINGTEHLSEGQARKVVDEVIGRAPDMTTGELRSKIQKLCLEIEPEAAKETLRISSQRPPPGSGADPRWDRKHYPQ